MYCLQYRSRDGAVVEHSPLTQTSHHCGPASIPGLGVICYLSLLLVLVLAPRGFPLSSNTNISKFQFHLESESHRFVSDWSPIEQRIKFEILLYTFKITNRNRERFLKGSFHIYGNKLSGLQESSSTHDQVSIT